MPELPEVETVVRGLREPLVGRTIAATTLVWPRAVAVPQADDFERHIVGRRVVSVARRGKYIVVKLDRGFLLVHLKMSGRLHVRPAVEPPDRHTRVILELDNGWQLRFQDARKFGRIYLVDDPAQVTGKLGPEPLDADFTLDTFRQLLARRSGRLKPLLLNQAFLAGLGNIYADEALFAAHLHPLRGARSLLPEEQARLYESIQAVLSRAIAGRGTTLDDRGYTDAAGLAGTYQEQIAVYGRKGAPCPQCGAPIQRIVIGGRSSHFCSRCQPEEIVPLGQGLVPTRY
jgi:formamidopyrimidine-DNA glycosylase